MQKANNRAGFPVVGEGTDKFGEHNFWMVPNIVIYKFDLYLYQFFF